MFGFWRSGTTWLQQMLARYLGRRTSFEPLTDPTEEAAPFLKNIDGVYKRRAYPYIRPNENLPKNKRGFFYKILKGKITNKWTNRSTKNTFAFSLSLVLKLTHGNLLAAYLEKQFNCKTVFITRNPYSVIASVVRNNWGADWLEKTEFLNLFTEQKNLKKDYLKKYKNIIKKYKGGAISNIALTYCITNLVPLKQLEDEELNSIKIKYEDLIKEKKKQIKRIGEKLEEKGLKINKNIEKIQPNKPAYTTLQKNRNNISNKERIEGWKNELKKKEIDRITEIINSFDGLEERVL